MTDVDDARRVVAQLLHVLRGVGDGTAEVEVPLVLRDLGPVEDALQRTALALADLDT